MQETDILTWFGYLASIVTAISLLMSQPLKLRWFNLLGSLLFAIYGILIEAYPVGFFNAAIVLIDAYYILQIYQSKTEFKEIMVTESDRTLKFFVEQFRDDILKFFPNLDEDMRNKNFYVLQMHEMSIIGIVVGNLAPNGKLDIAIDYISPNYRDYKPGKYFFNEAPLLIALNVNQVIAKSDSKIHTDYLSKIGFTKEGDKYQFTKK